FGTHFAFVAARPAATLLGLCLDQVRERLIRGMNAPNAQRWDHLGNAVLPLAMDEVIRRWVGFGAIPAGGLRQSLDRASGPTRRRARGTLFRRFPRRTLTMLDRLRCGFIPEGRHFRHSQLNAIEQYRRFWFEDELDPRVVISASSMLIGLHHSWTPD